MNDDAPGRAVSTQAVLEGLRVLFLPKNSRTGFFKRLLADAAARHGWQIHIVCPESGIEPWSSKIGKTTFSALPDFERRQDWEGDQAALADLDAYIARCERASGVSAGRIVLAGERDIGRGFSRPAYNWFHNRIAKTVLADTSQPFRIVRRIFSFARETLASAKPDLVVAGEWADPLCFAFRLAAHEAGIDCAVNRPSKIWSGRCYWSSEPLMYNHRSREAVMERRRLGAPVSARARERIAEFRVKPETLGYVRQNWEAADSQGWLGYHGQIARMFGAQVRYAIGGRKGSAPKPAMPIAIGHYQRPWLKLRQRRHFTRLDEVELAALNYVFLAFHKDPEQALNYQAPFWANQLNTAALISGALPAGYRLLVREHRLNAGRRPGEFYNELRRLPQVILIDGFDDQFKYTANADLIVTDNGSTGWEGLMLGRRVLTLAENFYEAAGLAHRVRAPEHLAEDIIALLGRPSAEDAASRDRALGWMIDAEWDATAPVGEEGTDRAFALLAQTLQDSTGPRMDTIRRRA